MGGKWLRGGCVEMLESTAGQEQGLVQTVQVSMFAV